MTSITEGLYDWLQACPLIDGNYMGVNYLEDGPLTFSLEEAPSQAVRSRYIAGSTPGSESSVREFDFILASRESYSADALENLRVSGLYERLVAWMEAQNAEGVLPALPAGMTARKVLPTTNGYALQTDPLSQKQRYQIQCKLTYYKE